MKPDKKAAASPEDMFLEEAFAAVADGDLDGFKEAMKGAIEACMGYGEEEEEGE